VQLASSSGALSGVGGGSAVNDASDAIIQALTTAVRDAKERADAAWSIAVGAACLPARLPASVLIITPRSALVAPWNSRAPECGAHRAAAPSACGAVRRSARPADPSEPAGCVLLCACARLCSCAHPRSPLPMQVAAIVLGLLLGLSGLIMACWVASRTNNMPAVRSGKMSSSSDRYHVSTVVARAGRDGVHVASRDVSLLALREDGSRGALLWDGGRWGEGTGTPGLRRLLRHGSAGIMCMPASSSCPGPLQPAERTEAPPVHAVALAHTPMTATSQSPTPPHLHPVARRRLRTAPACPPPPPPWPWRRCRWRAACRGRGLPLPLPPAPSVAAVGVPCAAKYCTRGAPAPQLAWLPSSLCDVVACGAACGASGRLWRPRCAEYGCCLLSRRQAGR
jgi:hypothetical protein